MFQGLRNLGSRHGSLRGSKIPYSASCPTHMRLLHAREQVGDDAIKQRQVVPQELRHVDLPQSPQQQPLLTLAGARALQVAC